ncbi:MAG: hypothetical protein RIK87_27385 [Fuerstiella sp.]
MFGQIRSLRRRRSVNLDPVKTVEQLECRVLLTGNVKVTLVRGDLRIDGDRGDNSIRITADTTGLKVTGLNQTTINGQAQLAIAPQDLPAQIDQVFINMGAGNDVIEATIPGIVIRRDLHVNMGSGHDRADINGGQVGGNVRLLSDGGSDVLQWRNFSVAKNLAVNLGSGHNFLTLTNGEIGKDLSIRSGRHADTITATGVSVARDASIHTDGGNDVVRVADSQVGRNTHVNLGGGRDELTVNNSQFGRRTVAVGGSKVDTLNGSSSLFARKPVIRGFERLLGDLTTAFVA